jgi:hypothetical protein
LDSDRNGFISGAEINRALQNQSLNATDRETLTAMRSRIGNIEEASNDEWFDENDGITRADLAQYGRQPGNSEEGRLVRRADRSLERSGASLSAANQNLFAHPDNPLEDIRPDAVSQGWTRDCLFMSTLASVANSNPQLIRNMIHDNGNRTYTVTFPGDRQHPVTVSAPTDSELAAFARGSERGLWPAVMERAYGAWRNNNGVIQENTSDRLWINVTQLLTGESSTRSHMWHMSHARIQEILANANRSPVVVGMDSEYFASIGISDNIDDATGLRRGHAYSVLGYDARTRTVTLRNPWGHGEPRDASGRPRDGIDDGVFTMSYDEFYGRFNAIIRTGN